MKLKDELKERKSQKKANFSLLQDIKAVYALGKKPVNENCKWPAAAA